MTAPKPGQNIQNAGRAPVLIAADQAEAEREAAAAKRIADETEQAKIATEAEREEAERKAAVAKREADEAAAEQAEADRKAKEAETERLAAEAARIDAEREDAERKAVVAKREADEAEAAKASEKSKTKPADTILNQVPPPPVAAEPAPTSVSTEQLNAYVGSLNAEQAKREADEAEAAAKAVSAAAVTGDMPAVTDPPPPSATPGSSPKPTQRAKRDPAVAMPAVTERQVRFRQNWPQIAFGTIAALFAIGVSIAVGCALYYGVGQVWSSPVTSTEPPHPTTAPANDTPSVAMPAVAAAIPIPNPEPVPHGLLPPPAPARNEQEGLRGTHGTRVRMSARAAFPVSCATAWGARRTDGVLYLCAHGQRRGNNLCDCDVTGTVP